MGGVIQRETAEMRERTFDLIVVGAGIHGAAAALHAARRGLEVLVIDRGDFGGETSWNSLRVLHGGLRYIQTADFSRFRESVRARSWYVGEFPTLIEPLTCLMPLYNKGLRRTASLRPALAVNEWLRRLWATAAERALIPQGRVLNEEQVRTQFPGVRSAGLCGGALWYDAYIPQPQRVLMEMLRRAVARGGVALNYVEATGCIVDEAGRIGGVEARDCLTGTAMSLRSRAVLNCAGPWAGAWDGAAASALDRTHFPSLAFNVLLDRSLDSDVTVAVEPAGGGRTYFLHPLGRHTLAGTYHAPSDGPEASPTEAQISEFIDDLAAALPGFGIVRDEVLRVLSGTLPARNPGTDEIAVRDLWIDARNTGGPSGLYTLVGVKYTTAPIAAELAIDRIVARDFSGELKPVSPTQPEPDPRVVPGWPAFALKAREDVEWARSLIQSIIDQESVTSVEDLLLRRTDWGLVPKEFDEAARLVRELCPDFVSLEG